MWSLSIGKMQEGGSAGKTRAWLGPGVGRFMCRGDAGGSVLGSLIKEQLMLLDDRSVGCSLLLKTASFREEERKSQGSIDISSTSVLTLLLLLFFRIAWLVQSVLRGPAVVCDGISLPGSEWCQSTIWQMLFRLLWKTWLQITQVQEGW